MMSGDGKRATEMIAPRQLSRHERQLKLQALEPIFRAKARILSFAIPKGYYLAETMEFIVTDDGLTPAAREVIAQLDEVIARELREPS